ncbi:hypothetical protein MTR67_025706 [Solanum verrucosum]|uniref:Uncharacterized protein n=1 Tax=Solanum verrucosum TaxID=315347 RepID=A0AAF0R5L8_SOLVR|nr:hypothetical protein MTR67_025706 [Solanum verrucosum]
MESIDLQILHSGEIEVDRTLLNSTVIAITENRNGYESGDIDIDLQQILFYSAQFHSDIDSIMPVDFLMRVRDDIQLTEVLALPIVIDCPFMDCMRSLYGDTAQAPQTTARVVVLSTSPGGGLKMRQCLPRLGQPWLLAWAFAPLPFLLTSSLDLLHPHLALGGLLDYRVLQDEETISKKKKMKVMMMMMKKEKKKKKKKEGEKGRKLHDQKLQ